MADDERERQRERFGEAVERKKQESERRSRAQGRGGDEQGVPDLEPTGGIHGDQESLYDRERPQDVSGPRDKSSGKKKKKTADNWNQ